MLYWKIISGNFSCQECFDKCGYFYHQIDPFVYPGGGYKFVSFPLEIISYVYEARREVTNMVGALGVLYL